MSQCVPDWNNGDAGGWGAGSCSLDVAAPGCGGLQVPREGHIDGGNPFAGTADVVDVWPWWDWDLDGGADAVAELKWADGHPRVQATAAAATTNNKPPTPTRPGTAAALAAASQPAVDVTTGRAEDLNLDQWLCAAAAATRTTVAADPAADAIVPGSSGRVPGAVDPASCLLVPDMPAPFQVSPAPTGEQLGDAGLDRKRPRKEAAGGAGCEQQGGGVKRNRHQPRSREPQQRRQQEDAQVSCTRKEGDGQRQDDDDDNNLGKYSESVKKARCRSALSERKRRDKFNQKIRTLQKLVPNCGKVDKVSILDEVIAHVRQLQAQAQMHMAAGVGVAPGLSVSPAPPPPMMMPAPAAPAVAAYMQQQFQFMAQMAVQMSQMGFRMGLAGANGFFPQPSPQALLDFFSSSRPLVPAAAPSRQPMMAPSGTGSGSGSGTSPRVEFAACLP